MTTAKNILLYIEFDINTAPDQILLVTAQHVKKISRRITHKKHAATLEHAFNNVEDIFKKVHETIVNRYYSFPPTYFEHNEPQLYKDFQQAYEELDDAVKVCINDISPTFKQRAYMLGAAGLSCGFFAYHKWADYHKRFGMF